MKVLYDLEQFSKLKNRSNDENLPCLPFKFNYFMWNKLINAEKPFSDSNLYDKIFLEFELWNRMCSMVLRDYMTSRYYQNIKYKGVDDYE